MRRWPRNFAENTENIENTARTEPCRRLGRSCPLLSAGVVIQQLTEDKSGDKRTTADMQRHSCDSKHPEAVSQGNPGSLRDSLDLPTFSFESVPCPSVSGLVHGGSSCFGRRRGD